MYEMPKANVLIERNTKADLDPVPSAVYVTGLRCPQGSLLPLR